MAHNGKHDKQQRGFQTTVQAAQQKAVEKFLHKKVTHRELQQLAQSFTNISRSLLSMQNWILDNVDGLRDKLNAQVAAEKAAQEAQAKPAEAPATPAPEVPSQEQ